MNRQTAVRRVRLHGKMSSNLISRVVYLYGLRVVDVSAQVHEHLWDEVGHLVWEGKYACTESNDTGVTADQLIRGNDVVTISLLNPRRTQRLKVCLHTGTDWDEEARQGESGGMRCSGAHRMRANAS